jgi:transposase
MKTVIPEEELQVLRERYRREHPTIAEILCQVAREDPSLTIAELAVAAERSLSWVRKTLKQAGIVLNKPVRQPSRRAQANKFAESLQQGARTRETAVLRTNKARFTRGR